jgi:glutamate dehydrogenase/leucine dehydrogenase
MNQKRVAVAGLGDVAKYLVEELRKSQYDIVVISREVLDKLLLV